MAPSSPSRRSDGDTRSTSASRRLDLNLHCGGSAGRNAWEDPSFAGANRLPPHSRRVRSMTALGGYTRGVCLDSGGDGSDGRSEADGGIEVTGGWTFRLFPDPHCIPSSCVAASSGEGGTADKTGNEDCEEGSQSFRSTAVPSCWTMTEASDPPRYTNVQMPFDTLYPHVPQDNPTGVYRLEFAPLAGGWRPDGTGDGRRRAVLHFAGVEGCFFVYLNGQFVGAGKDSRLLSEFEVTDLLRYERDVTTAPAAETQASARNVLAVVVVKWSDASFLEQHDHWRGMAGIHRSVYLYSTPGEAFLEDVFARASVVVSGLEEGTEDGGARWDDRTPRHRGRLDITARIGRDQVTRVAGRNVYYNEEIECERGGDATYRTRFRLRCKAPRRPFARARRRSTFCLRRSSLISASLFPDILCMACRGRPYILTAGNYGVDRRAFPRGGGVAISVDPLFPTASAREGHGAASFRVVSCCEYAEGRGGRLRGVSAVSVSARISRILFLPPPKGRPWPDWCRDVGGIRRQPERRESSVLP